MYAESDFLLALIKDDDWLADSAEEVYERHRDDLWTSHYTLIELMVVAYRDDRNVQSVVANAKNIVEVRGDAELVLAAASYVEEEGMTPFDAVHLVASDEDRIVSSDSAYDALTERVPLEPDS